MKKVLVTGAGGFIGSNLVEALVLEGCEVTAFLHYNSRSDYGNLDFIDQTVLKNVRIVSGDIQDFMTIRKAVSGHDTVMHLAALIAIPYSYHAPESYVKTNVLGTLNVLQACLDEEVSMVIHTSTSETYGTAIYTPIDENHPLQGQSPYSASKIGADKIAESFYRSFDLPVATIRPFNTFGPGQSARAIIPTIISQALTTKDNTIHLGLLTPVRDLTFVKDTVKGFIDIGKKRNTIGRVVNIGSGTGITIGDLAGKIITQINPEIQIKSDENRIRPEKSEVMELICNNQAASELLGWRPAYTLDSGLSETIDFIKDHLDFYKPNIYNI